MNENSEQEQRVDEPIQPFAGPPGAPGGTTVTNFQNFPDDDINTYPGGAQAFFSRPGVCYNAGGASNIGQYANFTDGNSGFSIYSVNAGSNIDIKVRKKSRQATVWSDRVSLYHSGNLQPKDFALKATLDAKADKAYVDTKADKTSVDMKLNTLNIITSFKANISTLPKIICVGDVSSNGNISYSGLDVACRQITGKYEIYPKYVSFFPHRYMVLVLPTSPTDQIFSSVSGLSGNYFYVNIKRDSSRYDCSFKFIMVEY